ncbi:MAG: GNAT family N-acetyltransferase, partial [Alphaproteobacteria bacterium]
MGFSVTTTSLEMTARPTRPPKPPPTLNNPLMLLRAERPTISFYRYLYNTVGAKWLWYERRSLDDDALSAIIHDEQDFIYVLHVGGVPAGFVELDCRDMPNIEIAYFGLMPEFIGRGLGGRLIDWALESA